MSGQAIRRSQFITTYGPGAILEGPDGPRIIPILENSSIYDQLRTTDFEITDMRLSQNLANNAGIIRLPSNAELGVPDFQHIYATNRFPAWSLCVIHDILYRKIENNDRACPHCDPLANRYEAWDQANRQAIRFIRACELGHMDDVDWIGIINHNTDDCHPAYLYWRGAGGALRHINIVCPSCGASINLGWAYSRPWMCSGRFPEQSRERLGCDRNSQLIQRGAANLHIPEIRTALTIPPRATPLHRLIEMTVIRAVIARPEGQEIHSKAEFIGLLMPLVEVNLLSSAIVTEIDGYDEETILGVIDDVSTSYEPVTTHGFRLSEFEALRHAATHGAPPEPSPTPGSPPLFEVSRSQVRSIGSPFGVRFRITPVNRLRVVMVQTGYRRQDPLNPVVDRIFLDDERPWYPGVELFGEGVFVDVDIGGESEGPSEGVAPSGQSANAWFDAWIDFDAHGGELDEDERHMLHPTFAWWHTFSHRLINALAIDSGYSSAAVRERVYANIDPEEGRGTGGVLLYTAQPGGDGTLGGLVALVPEFERVLEAAFRNLDACSNDPLCGDERFVPGRYNGAACYACALVSETSCEHRNMNLDRHLLLETAGHSN